MKSRAQTLLHKTTIQRPVTTLTALAGFLSLTLLALNTAATSHAQALLYEFNPVSTSTAATSTGTNTSATASLKNLSGTAANLYDADGSGVSGLPGDRAINVSAGLLQLAHSASSTALDGLTSFTLAGWYKTNSGLAGGNRLFDYTSGTNGIILFGDGSTGAATSQLSLQVNGTNIAISDGSYTANNGEWVFFAVSVNLTAGNKTATFYQGTATSLATSITATINTTNLNNTSSITAPASAALLNIGNSGGFNRAVNGSLDNMAVFQTALTEAEVRAFQIRGAPQLVPEPATNALALATAAATLASLAALRRRHHGRR